MYFFKTNSRMFYLKMSYIHSVLTERVARARDVIFIMRFSYCKYS